MKRLYIAIIAQLLTMALWAQGITVNAPHHVGVGEQFRLTYTMATQDVHGFRAGNIPDGLEVLMGPSTSSQTSIQVINGHTTSSSSLTYTYIIYPEKAGTYTIGGAHARVGGKDASSASVKITVSGSGNANNNGGNNSQSASSMYQQQPGAQVRSAGSHISGNDLFIKVSANKQKVYEQEPVLLTYKVYTQVELTQLEGKMPDLNGFHTQEVELPQQKSFHMENVNGKPYRCVTWSQYVMYPQKTGKLEIPEITFKGIVVQENRNVDPFEAFFNGGSGYVEVKKDIVANGMSIEVMPLPEKPAGFSGGVGHFNISGQLLQQSVKAGDAVTLRVVVSGNGNLKLIKQPEIQWPKDFDKYDPKVTDKTKLTANGLEGNVIYDCMAAPKNPGDYEISGIKFVFFDTETHTYKTITTEPFKLHVTQGSGDGASSDNTNAIADIRDIKKGQEKTTVSDNIFATPLYWCTIVCTFLLFIALIVIFRKRALEHADIVKMRGKKANKVATKRLKKAAGLMKQHKQNEFYDEVLRALWGYVGDKLNIPVSELSRDNITDQLLTKNVGEMTVSTFVNAIDECEFARYAPGEAQGKMNIVYEKAIRAITEIDEFLKGKRNDTPIMSCLLVIIAMSLSSNALAAVTKTEADANYDKKNYSKAIADYKQLLNKEKTAELYFNLGNAYYRTDSLPQAILSYERAHRISPADKEINDNLVFARSKTIDKMQDGSSIFIVTWWKQLRDSMNPNGWAVTAIILLIAVVILLLVYLFAEAVWMRQLGFFAGIACFVIFITSNIMAWQQTSMQDSTDEAIVVTASCPVKKTASLKAEEECVIHEASKVTITDETVSGWYEIELSDGRTGWIETKAVEKI